MSEDSNNKLFQVPFSFKGRIRRLEYLYSLIGTNIVGFILRIYFSIQEECTGAFIFDIILLFFMCWSHMPKDAKDAMILDYRDGIKSFPSFSLYFYLRMETLTRINMVTIPNGEQ